MAESNQLWSEAVRTLERQQPFALATVVNVRGSTPREIGAKMIIRRDGQYGTIGGGCGEAEVFRKARLLLEHGEEARLAAVDLTGDFDQQEVGSCGGIMDVFIDMWSPADLALAHRLADSPTRERAAALLTLVDPGPRTDVHTGAKLVIGSELPGLPAPLSGLSPEALSQLAERAAAASPGLVEVGMDGSIKPVVRLDGSNAPRLFIDPIVGAQRLIIAGAGHIALPLATMGSMLGFHVTVIDDRVAFANRERFPAADQIIVKPFGAAIAALELDRYCYLVSVTRGHAFDEAVLRSALRQLSQSSPPTPCFLGMIGSRRRVRAMLTRLEEEGFERKLLEQIHAPLGLDIGGETPEEIAISIIAEIIRERRTGVRDALSLGLKSGRLRPTA